ncbi:hypothetical protein CFU_2770 [Collimonas fungivorans Ter331]|uniref:Uncharacterized protein n=1 Tax=Collimonas fungivorans (strain Ter331) TaxID=1005048 RepID=G0A9H4_COLFT|nr:hypothetical protein CFU_2770 [Collimonas fungivorans Ter331]
MGDLPGLGQHIENTGKIQPAGAALAVDVVQVARQRAERHAAASGQRIFHRQPEVLEHQVDAEAAGIALGRRRIFHHSRTRVVDFQRPVAARTFRHDFRQHLGIHAVRHAEPDRLAAADHQDPQQHVVAHLDGLAAAVVAGVENCLAHFFQVWLGQGKAFGGTADHESQGTGGSTAGAARNRRIEHGEAFVARRRRHLARSVGSDGRAVDQQRARRRLRQDAVGAEVGALNVAAGRQHRDDDPGCRHRGRQIAAGAAAAGDKLVDAGRQQVMAADLAAGLHQVQRHRQTHIAEADKNDVATHVKLSCDLLGCVRSLHGNRRIDLAAVRIRRKPARGHGLGLGPELHRLLAVGAEVAQLGSARTGKAEISHRHRDRHIDADLADIDLVLELARGPARGGKDRRAVAVRVGVDEGNRFVQRLQFDHTHGRAEDLLRIDIHLGGHAGKNGRTDKIAVGVTGHLAVAAIQQQPRALLHARSDQAFGARLGGFRHHRPEVGLAVAARPDLQAARTLNDFRQPGTRLAHQQHHRIRHAALAGGAECRAQQVVDGLVLVGVGQHDAVVLGAHHALRALAGFAGTAIDMGADSGRADEGNRLDVGMVAQHVGHLRAAMHHVQHARRQTGLLRQFDQEQRRRRVLFGRLQDEGIAAGDRYREHEARQHHREVERRDAGADAERLVDGVDIDAGGGIFGQFAQLQRSDGAGVLDHFQAAHHFAFGIRQGLAVLARNQLGQRRDVFAQQLLELEHDAHALRQRSVAPAGEGLLGVGYRVVDFSFGGERHARHYFLGRRIEDIAPFGAGRLHGLAADI